MEDTHAVKKWMQRLGYALLPILVIGGLAFVVHSAALLSRPRPVPAPPALWVGAISMQAPKLDKRVTVSP
jgi:hypothetical protein